MREFQFQPGNDWCPWDVRRKGRPHAVWELVDVRHAMEAHAKKFGLHRTMHLFRGITGREDAISLPRKYFGPLIACYADELVTRTHEHT
jgi:hypothetical protein